MHLQFYLRFHTEFGQSLWISGNTEELGMDVPANAIPMVYLDDEFWQASIPIPQKKWPKKGIVYKYYLKTKDGELVGELGHDRVLTNFPKTVESIKLIDTWNHAGEYENAFFTAPFKNVLLKHPQKSKWRSEKQHTHIFKIKAPLLNKHETICLSGSTEALGNWSAENPILLLQEDDWWSLSIDLTGCNFPIAYKYGVYNSKEETFINYEAGANRLLHADALPHSITVLHDGFIRLPNDTWKGAGVAIPVFSLRSKNGFGVGEFADIKLLVDWAKEAGLKLIQILPVNDTIATNTWMDSYPYAAISAFALHPLYINLEKVAGKKHSGLVDALKKKQKQLNELPEVNYEEVVRFKLAVLKELYHAIGSPSSEDHEYKHFFEDNKHWLVPYAAFCYLRDKYGSSHYNDWNTHSVYDKDAIDKLFHSSSSKKDIGFYCFVQYQLHLQLKEAADYAHKKGIVLKGDIPIGIYRYGCDAWVAPQLYNMDAQAGAPPDDFTPIGQNWEFPTYNWKRMQKDDFAWWKQRFEQMSNYFDTFRIDHILGFFRIWSIPADAVQGIMGRFVPCIPVHYVEFGENGIWFDEARYCEPFITEEVLNEVFDGLTGKIKQCFITPNDRGGYDLKPEFATQRKVEAWFEKQEETEENNRLKLGLYDLISNVIFFRQEGSRGQEFHFRISMEKTLSFKYLIPHVQERLRNMYINYFFRRQDEFWRKEAMHKLPRLKEATNMLICGEDLGMVPHCVPEVMKQLGILSLEIQRMPKDAAKEFFNPTEAPYLSVITPSTHDMSTVRGWWEENREKTQHFYNQVLGQWGDAPYFCESWVSRAIILQHLYSPAMWSIFQLQDILGMSDTLRRENPHDERINNPAVPKHYWRYRMHISLEDLIKEKDFNEELKGYVIHSGR
ncbi:4-alpha-glucanotransferase [Terrimonas pollutisoli]|uniref:4-alpha-glucanotransferase n=1 Tax=Terrimonas pollutisoli TaxID=3034147 RepID=UPI0023ED98DC|nr:4-alpha-glucanotransferase [Terrimonas sp. H1YJ31]